jgi:hypothetical protein
MLASVAGGAVLAGCIGVGPQGYAVVDGRGAGVVVVRDRVAGTTQRVSVTGDGSETDADSIQCRPTVDT